MSELPVGLHIRKIGSTVEVRGRLTLAEAADDWILLFELPDGYRPERTIVCGLESQSGPLEVWIEPDGSVVAHSPRVGWIEFEQVSFPAV
jgi:hypothetical protein